MIAGSHRRVVARGKRLYGEEKNAAVEPSAAIEEVTGPGQLADLSPLDLDCQLSFWCAVPRLIRRVNQLACLAGVAFPIDPVASERVNDPVEICLV